MKVVHKQASTKSKVVYETTKVKNILSKTITKAAAAMLKIWFMYIVGVIEIIAGIGVFLKPKIFACVVSAWLVLIIINLLMIPEYFDIALRDLGL